MKRLKWVAVVRVMVRKWLRDRAGSSAAAVASKSVVLASTSQQCIPWLMLVCFLFLLLLTGLKTAWPIVRRTSLIKRLFPGSIV